MPHQNAQLALFVQHMPAAIALLDRSFCYQVVSSRWRMDFGLGPGTLGGTSHFDHFLGTEQSWRTRLERALAGETLQGSETPITRVTGRTYWVNWELRPWYLNDGEIGGVTLFAEDQTARKLAQDALKRQEANMRAILDNSRQAFILVDTDYRVVTANRLAAQYAEQIAGLPAAPGRPVLDYAPEGLRRRFRSRIDRAMAGERLQAVWETEHATWLEINYTPVESDGAVSGVCISLYDVSVRKRSERALAQYNDVLEKRNRDLQEFAYVASHDLQEPLRKVRAFSNLLQDEYSEQIDDEGQFYMSRVLDASERMSTLINALLAYARISTRKRELTPTDLNAVLEDVVSDLELVIAEREADVEIGALPTLKADHTQMRQLFQNLIGNAIKFQRPGHSPHVSILQREPTGGQNGRAMAEIVIQDNGIGFEEGQAERIFDPFQRLHGRSRFEGTGMGLAICRRIAERHGGTLFAAGKPGEGATFVLRLPLTLAPESRPVTPLPATDRAAAPRSATD